jgi:hypothetical protein
MEQVEAHDLPALHSLVAGLRRDIAAVTAGLTLPWSSGAVEGNVNRIILWNQDAQTPDVRPGQLRPPPQADPPHRLKARTHHKIFARTELRDRNPLSWGNYVIADTPAT